MIRLIAFSLVSLLAVVVGVNYWPASTATQAEAPQLSDAQIQQLLAAIRPSEGEDMFATIPWQTNLWEARKLAAKEGKPLLLWEMDGNPLGCG